MPTSEWVVDDTVIKVTRVPRVRVDVDVAGQRIVLPANTLGAWDLPVPDRHVRLEARRNLDVIRYVVLSDGHEIPIKTGARRAAAADTRCTPHDAAAICRCARCDAAACKPCSPDGWHCASCLLVIAEESRAKMVRLRRFGFLGALALGAIILGAGLALHVVRAIELGAATLGLTLWLTGWMLWKERAERARGLPSAIDRPGVGVARATVVSRDSAKPRDSA